MKNGFRLGLESAEERRLGLSLVSRARYEGMLSTCGDAGNAGGAANAYSCEGAALHRPMEN